MAKRVIRKDVYETNSSSTHAMCISKTQKIEDIKLPDSVDFGHGEFGWEFEIYRKLSSKANYLNEALSSCYSGEKLVEKKIQLFNMLKDKGVRAFFNSDKYEIDYWMLGSDYGSDYKPRYSYESGYIDHGYNAKQFVDAVLEDADLLIKYLFGDSFVVTGNDNSDGFSDYMYKEDPEDYWSMEYKDEFADYQIFRKGN